MHLEVLPNNAKRLFSALPAFKGFYLAGGTALALQIGHRVSVDFDLFSSEPISAGHLDYFETIYGVSDAQVLVSNSSELSVILDEVKFTFLHYPFPILARLENIEGLDVLSIEELAATKAYTIGRRISFKDYVDLYFCVHGGHTSLNQIVYLAEQKYGEVFNDKLFLEQLQYDEDFENESINFLHTPVTKQEIKQFFVKAISQFVL